MARIPNKQQFEKKISELWRQEQLAINEKAQRDLLTAVLAKKANKSLVKRLRLAAREFSQLVSAESRFGPIVRIFEHIPYKCSCRKNKPKYCLLHEPHELHPVRSFYKPLLLPTYKNRVLTKDIYAGFMANMYPDKIMEIEEWTHECTCDLDVLECRAYEHIDFNALFGFALVAIKSMKTGCLNLNFDVTGVIMDFIGKPEQKFCFESKLFPYLKPRPTKKT